MAGFLFVGVVEARRRTSRTGCGLANIALPSPAVAAHRLSRQGKPGSRARSAAPHLRHCEERSDEAIQSPTLAPGLLRCARNDARGRRSTREARTTSADAPYATLRTNPRDLAAPSARAMCHSHRPLLTEGAGKAGRWPRPWPACRKESRRQSPQVWPKHPALPARWLYDLYAISLGTGCLAPITRRQLISNAHRLDLSTGRPGPRDFTVRPGSFVGTANHAAIPSAHRIPHPTSVTTAKRPLVGAGRAE